MEKKHVEAERPDQKGGMPFQLFLETMTRNWNQLCSSLPLSIAGLGDLANASTVMERDFTIKDQQPEGRLSRFLLNPQCFALFVWRVIHASKMAVNSACTSMNEFTTLTGHVLFCMQKIPLNSQQTVSQPDGLCVAKEMKIIEPGHTLSLVRKCQGSADETRTAFEHLGDLVAKVVNVCDPSKNGGPKLLRRQIETYEDFLKTWRSHQDKIGAELHKNFLRSSRHLYDTRAAFREVRKGYPGWLQYLDASLCDHLESLFSPLDREGNMSIKLLFSTYDAKLHCAYDQLCFAEKKFEEEYDKSDAWFDREKRLPHILQKQSSMNEIDPQPALELLEKAHADLDSLKKLTIQLMDYCELLMDAIRTPDKEDQTTRPTEVRTRLILSVRWRLFIRRFHFYTYLRTD